MMRTSTLLGAVLVALVLFTGVQVLAEGAITTLPIPDISYVDADPAAQIQNTVTAWVEHSWGVAVGGTIMVLIWVLVSFFWTSFPVAWIPLLAAVLGVLSTVGYELVNGRAGWQAVITGLTTGAAASGFWSLIGKYTLGKVKKTDA